eukprot:TRINITY_DN17739_c0_g1_i12.p1 TRINITY_DN17739_c0_g1~~TRINITY_DN17739_c0_g1_i12.p1  ORF type:complete len:471 (-),score=69.56 TRINITY_DN17739_c0_g1_i12:574-1800(-)
MKRILFPYLLLLFASAQLAYGALPPESKFEGVFKGEGIGCDATSANVLITNDFVVESKEGVVEAVREAIALSAQEIIDSPTEDTVIVKAYEFTRLILEVVAKAEAYVKIDINSPQPGCWAIGFGKAEAVAIAEATITGVAQGFAAVLNGDKLRKVQDAVNNVEQDIQVAIEKVALRLEDGSGGGIQSQTKTAIAEAKAVAINCAIAQAFAGIADVVSEAVLVQVGCDEPVPALARFVEDTDCTCVQTTSQGVPSQCGKWGDEQNGDNICYVNSSCSCGQDSLKYSDVKWRYCGDTLGTMKNWLDIEDIDNEIYSKFGEYGYCPKINPGDDVMAHIGVLPQPPIVPPQLPIPQTLPNCPIFSCIGDARECCATLGGTCNTRFGTRLTYVGMCKNGKHVWDDGIIQCACN